MVFEQGDIVEVTFSPALGHEPKKKRPAIVVSNNTFNGATSMPLVCPITTTDNGFFLHEPVPAGHDIHGFIAMEQMRTMDLDARQAEVIDHLEQEEMRPILACLKSFL